MRIIEIHIEGFGKLSDFKIKNLSDGINLIFGENEAGKSTLMKFVIYTLFGYPTTKRSLSNMEPVNGGAHGGRLLIDHSTHGILWFERFYGPNGGQLRIYNQNGDLHQEAEDLLYEISEHQFRNIYAITIDELNSSGSIAGSEFFEMLISRNMGLRNVNLTEVRDELKSRKKALLGHGKKGLLNEILEEKEGLEQIKESQRQEYEQYYALKNNIKTQKKVLISKREQLEKKESELIDNQRILDMYPEYLRFSDNDRVISTLPLHESLNTDKLKQVISLKKNIDKLTAEIDVLDQELTEADSERRQLQFDDSLILKKDEIEELKSNYKYIENLISQVKSEKIRLTNMKKEIDYEAKQLGFDEKKILHLKSNNNLDRSRSFVNEYKNIKTELSVKEKAQNEKLRIIQSDPSSKKFNIFLITLSLLSFLTGFIFYGKNMVIPSVGSFFLSISFVIYLILKQRNRTAIMSGLYNEIEEERTILDSRFESHLNTYLRGRDFATIYDLEQWVDKSENLLKKVGEWISNVKTYKFQESELHQFEEQVEQIHQQKINRDDLFSELKNLLNEYEEALLKERKLFEIKQKVSDKERLWNDKLRERQQYITEYNYLLEAFGLDSDSDFNHLLEKSELRTELEKQNSEILFACGKVFGLERITSLDDIFKGIDPKELEKNIDSIKEICTQLKKETDILTENLARNSQTIENLEKGSEEFSIQKLAINEARLLEKTRGYYQIDYLQCLIEKATENLENSIKPTIIKEAAKIFSRITKGKYSFVQEEGNQFVSVSGSDGKKIKVDDLSRGAKEQLYLSIRLAMIKAKAEPVPILLDDILVNFDDVRLNATIDELRRISRSHQILLFSCHTSMKKCLDENVIKI
ncbi:AAA family ATPase [Mangrovivirga sp. M17]|uniref:AAA family ATPase n=1 Tax=Mangrovivirga halotolerans TaxID=2993936 RepID=A0ABT3RR62_9BACT|nr:AAA family ATPase [Mangrovivirga halotolerans]MCX2744266.1 AAA family ATPase [Mangrovivirga halotolerans]